MQPMNKPTDEIFQFPCDFPIKVVGKATPEFEAFVVTTVRKYVTDLNEGAIEIRPSQNGNFTAITVTIRATSKQQLDSIYLELTASKLVIMAL